MTQHIFHYACLMPHTVSMAISITVGQLFPLLTRAQQLYAFPPFYLSLLHIVLFLHVLLPLCVRSLCDLVSSFFLFLFFSLSFLQFLSSVRLYFASSLPSPSIFRYLLFSAFPFIHLSCFFSGLICVNLPSFSRLLLHSLLSSSRFLPFPGCPSGIMCLRAHGGVCRAPSCLTQCSLLPASICWSSGPHRPAQRAGWGAGKRQSLPEPAQDWITGYTHTHTFTQ